MNSPRDILLCIVAVVALGVGGFAAGLWVGEGRAARKAQDDRIAVLEQRLGLVDAARRPARAAAPPEAAPAAAAPIDIATAGAPALGPEDAPVTLVAFSDFQCPYCARVVPTLEQLRAHYGDRLRVVFKHYPLPSHPEAVVAHRAAEAAGRQGPFWEMHDRLFADPKDLSDATLRAHAEALGLDVAAFEAARRSDAVERRVEEDRAEGSRAGVRGTPTFFINGSLFSGAQPLQAFQSRIDAALAAAQEVAAR